LATLLFIAPTDTSELAFGYINYARAWSEGLVWTEAGASVSHSRDGGVSPLLASVSEVERYYARITVPVLRARSQSMWVHLVADGRNTELFDPLGSDADEAVRALRASANYTLIEGDTRGDAMVEVAHGFDAFGASQNGEADLTRADARPQFTKVRLDVSATHKFSDRWEVFVAAAGQLADGPVVAAEEFGGGGARFGRAYDYSEIIGDHGLAGLAELRWTWRNAFKALTSLQLYAYVDAVRIWNAGSDAAQLADADLSSVGGGLRLTPVPGVHGAVELAVPWSRDVGAEGDRSARVFVSLALGW
jgi:hemolysin activation/secretion protein